MLKAIDHFGVAIHDRDEAIRFFEDALGFAVYGIATDPTSGLKNGLIRVGETDFMIQQPPRPGEDPEADPSYIPPRDPSPIRQIDGVHLDTATFIKYLDKWGEGIHHNGVRVDNLKAAWRTLKDKGITLFDDLSTGERPGVRDSQLFFPDPKETYSVLLQFVERCASDSLVWNEDEGGWVDAGLPPDNPLFDGLNGLHHVGLRVEGVDEAAAFFRETLGLELIEEGVSRLSGLPWYLLKIGKSAYMLRDVQDKRADGHPLDTFPPTRGKGIHYVALRAPSVDKVRARVESTGRKVIENPSREGSWDPVMFLDPRESHGIVFGICEME